MKIVKARIRLMDNDSDCVAIVRAILEFYPIDSEIIREASVDGGTEFIFHMSEKDLGLLRHDIELLRICGFNIRKARS